MDFWTSATAPEPAAMEEMMSFEEQDLAQSLDELGDDISEFGAPEEDEGRFWQETNPPGPPLNDHPHGEPDPVALVVSGAFTAEDEKTELASMTVSEMVNVESDLRGITTGISNLWIRGEAPDLEGLENEMARLPPEQKAAYSRALTECPSLVSDDFKKAFLETEDNNPKLAAVRLALFWEYRLDLFGPERCFLPMTLSGAMRDEAKNVVERRVVQLLPARDTAGRAILYLQESRRNFAEYSAEQEIKAIWYFFEVAMEDPEVQRRGVVLVVDTSRIQQTQFSPKVVSWQNKFGQLAFPMRLRAIHVCYPSFMVKCFLEPIAKLMVGRDLRRRFQLHAGSTAEVLKALEGACLPKGRLPTAIGGDITLDMAKWVSDRRAWENYRMGPRLVSDQQHSIAQGSPTTKGMGGCSSSLLEKETTTTTGHKNAPVKVKRRPRGRPPDPRMNRAVEARLRFPDWPPLQALQFGGFTFDSTDEVGEPVDSDNITLTERKNQLCRRLRELKKSIGTAAGAGTRS